MQFLRPEAEKKKKDKTDQFLNSSGHGFGFVNSEYCTMMNLCYWYKKNVCTCIYQAEIVLWVWFFVIKILRYGVFKAVKSKTKIILFKWLPRGKNEEHTVNTEQITNTIKMLTVKI